MRVNWGLIVFAQRSVASARRRAASSPRLKASSGRSLSFAPGVRLIATILMEKPSSGRTKGFSLLRTRIQRRFSHRKWLDCKALPLEYTGTLDQSPHGNDRGAWPKPRGARRGSAGRGGDPSARRRRELSRGDVLAGIEGARSSDGDLRLRAPDRPDRRRIRGRSPRTAGLARARSRAGVFGPARAPSRATTRADRASAGSSPQAFLTPDRSEPQRSKEEALRVFR